MSEVIEVRIDKLNQLVHFSKAYTEGSLQMNVSRIARELQCDRKTVRNRLNGKTPTKTRKKKKYLDEFRENMLNYLKDSNRHFEYVDHLYYFMKREHSITCCRTTLNRYIRNDSELSKAFKANEGASFTERFETSPGQQAQFDMKEKVQLVDQLKNYSGTYTGILDIHNKLEMINQEDNERISQATRLPRVFLLQKEKGNQNILGS